MIKHLYLLTFSLLFLGACTDSSPEKTEEILSVKGGKHYGGTLSLNESSFIESLFPHHISDAVATRISSQIYEGLLKLNPKTLAIESCLADTFYLDSTHTEYTFILKDNVYFHDAPCFENGKGRLFTSEDVINSFTKLCENNKDNHAFSVFHNLVVGADAYYNAGIKGRTKGVSGLSAPDAKTVKIKLIHPSTVFPYILTEHQTYIFPKELLSHFDNTNLGHEVGTGPFMVSQIDKGENKRLFLKRHPNYHGRDEFGNKLPFLDGLFFSFLEDKKLELDSFKTNFLDLVYKIPNESLFDLHQKQHNGELDFEFTEQAEMSLDYIGFNTQSSLYKNKDLRKAISFAIDKKMLLERSLSGEADLPGYFGITPPIFQKQKNYPVDNIKSHSYNVDSAKFYLEKSGVFNAKETKNLTLHYNSEGNRNVKIAKGLSRQLKETLGIDLLIISDNQIKFDHLLNTGKADLFLSSWIYEYPHPQHHLEAFYSDNIPLNDSLEIFPNVFRYQNKTFDQFYAKAFSEENKTKSFKLYKKAEQIVMDDAALIVLWYNEGYEIMQTEIKDFDINPIQYRDFRKTYIKPIDVIKTP